MKGQEYLSHYHQTVNGYDHDAEHCHCLRTARLTAYETIEKSRAQIISPFEPMRPNTIDEFFNRPDWYDPPRKIQLGIQFSW